MSDGLAERILLVQRLSLALTNDTLQLYYQPQVNFANGELVGAEALLRWHDEILGWISPVGQACFLCLIFPNFNRAMTSELTHFAPSRNIKTSDNEKLLSGFG